MFNYYTELVAKWVQLVQLMHKFVPLRRIGIFSNKRTRPTPFRTVWVHFGLFRYYMKLGAKWAELQQLMQKFVP